MSNAKQPEDGGIYPVAPEKQFSSCWLLLEIAALACVGVFTGDEGKLFLAVLAVGAFFIVPSLIAQAWKKCRAVKFSEVGLSIGRRLFDWSELNEIRITERGRMQLRIAGKKRASCRMTDRNAQKLLEFAQERGTRVQRELPM